MDWVGIGLDGISVRGYSMSIALRCKKWEMIVVDKIKRLKGFPERLISSLDSTAFEMIFFLQIISSAEGRKYIQFHKFNSGEFERKFHTFSGTKNI